MSLIVVAPEDLDNRLAETSGPVFLRYKSDSCHHCVNMSNSWNDVADATAPEGMNVMDVDVSNGLGGSSHMCTNMFKNSGGAIPRMYLVNKKKITEYDGERNTDAMLKAAREFIGRKNMSGGRMRVTRKPRHNGRKRHATATARKRHATASATATARKRHYVKRRANSGK